MPNDFELDPVLEAQTDNDGAVPLLSGYEVLGRILAQRGPVKYTKALLDSGDIPEGTVIDSLTGPIEEAGEGMIAKVENTGTGEATVTVQATSIGVPVGFACKGVVLYVEDPDTSEDVAYTYLDLHQHPAWIRAEGGATGSLTTFEIQSIISGATSVQAIINPNALARIVDLEKYALLGHSHQITDIVGLRTELDDQQASIELLNDLVSGDMPGGINKTADFYTLAGITIRDGTWNQTARTISA